MKRLWQFSSCMLAAVAGLASAQQPATTVQLPTFSQFTVQTTVSVPDGGTAYLGGIDRAVDSSVSRGLGPLRSRGLSGGRSASGVSVSATIIDHAEIDRAILAAAAGREPMMATNLKAREIAAGVPNSRLAVNREANPSTNGALPGSVAAIRAANAAEDEQRINEIAGNLAKAEKAEAEGKASVAKVYYQMVARSGVQEYRQRAVQRLAALSNSSVAK